MRQFLSFTLLGMLTLSSAFSGPAAGETLQRADGSPITYYLKQTEGDKLLVLVQGSDCNSVYHNDRINRQFSQVIEDADILTVEKYGIDQRLVWRTDAERDDCPELYLKHDSPQQRVSDYRQVIKQLTQSKLYRQVIVLGGSEGALVAHLLGIDNEQVDAVVSLNGGGRYFIDDVLYNMRSQMPPEAYQEAEAGFRQFAQSVVQNEAMDITVSGHGFPWWKQMLTIDQQSVLAKVTVPLLLIQAGQDTNVDPASFTAMVKALKDTRPNLQPRNYASLDHRFQDQQGHSHTGQVVQDIRLWLATLRQ
ncbi:alpha/beta hydrolase family protein [Photobacterium sp. R1]